MAMIYIVEDDENIREIEMFALKNAGYEVQGFECASDFYARLKEKVPALVLLDIMLPDEDGLSIVKKLRHAADTRKLPIIMATAKTTELDKVKGLDIGADDYITKPFGVMELISRVKALMRRSRGMEEERMIRVYMDMKNTQLYISFTNFTATKKLQKVGKGFHTTKGEGHGFGLVRIDNIVERLDGYLSRNSEDGAFTTEILIPQE